MPWYWIVALCLVSCAAGWVGASLFGANREGGKPTVDELSMAALFARAEAAEHTLAEEREQTREAEQRIADALHGEEVR